MDQRLDSDRERREKFSVEFAGSANLAQTEKATDLSDNLTKRDLPFQTSDDRFKDVIQVG